MRVLIFFGFLLLSVLVPVGLTYAEILADQEQADALAKSSKVMTGIRVAPQ